MKKTLITTTLTVAALTLTACGSDDTADQGAANTSTEPITVSAPNDGAERLTGEDYSHLLVMSRWVPNDHSEDPVSGSAHIKLTDNTTDRDVESYTPDPFGFEIPSIDTDKWFTEYLLVDDGMNLSASFSTSADPQIGQLECAVLSLETAALLDFQQSAGEDAVHCYAFMHDDHDYEPGVPAVDLP